LPATIRDVAREAGVSVATVSRVLNGSGPVSDATRERVRSVAATLRYTPHFGARSLSSRRTQSVGVILPDLYGEFFSEVIRGMDGATRAAGYHLLLSGYHADDAQVTAALRAMRGRVDGLVLMSPDILPDELQWMVVPGSPVVLVNSGATDGRFDTLDVDNGGGAYAAVHHLASLGHSRIGLIGGEPLNHDACARRKGYRAALETAGLPWRAEWEVDSDFTKSGGYAAAGSLARLLHERPTAVFAANDSMAVGAMSAFHEAGIRVPQDVAVVGFDDIPMARYVTPTLSTVRVDLTRLGHRSIDLLLAALRDGAGHEPRHDVVETSLVIRRSCGSQVHEHGPG
jgi:LacI family transcriptional regulator